MPVGTVFKCNGVVLRITQIGKECHNGCEIYKKMGDCIMPREGVFLRGASWRHDPGRRYILEGGCITMKKICSIIFERCGGGIFGGLRRHKCRRN